MTSPIRKAAQGKSESDPELDLAKIWAAGDYRTYPVVEEMSVLHAPTCRAYGNYQPPYEDCTCGAEK